MNKRHTIPRLPLLALLACIAFAPAAPAETGDAHPRSPRNASYYIDVELDPVTKTLDGRTVLAWRNIRERSTDELWFHLYWNGWRNNRSTWMLEAERRGRSVSMREDEWSWVEVDSVRLLPGEGYDGADLIASRRFAAPDDGNPDDRTVMVVDLPRPVEPGETVRVELAWRARVPRDAPRTGFRGDYFFLGQWFPKLGVFEGDGWNCHQFHAVTEFFSDYGVYDVRMTVPGHFVVGATGREVERRVRGDGRVTHRYRQADVHDFAWTASPSYLVREARFDEPGLPPADIRLLVQPEHAAQADRLFEATRAALRLYGTWFGPYPYGHVTVVDPVYGSSSSGMEYPTLFTTGTRLSSPAESGSPEGVTVHEAGHQFWYGIVGNNEAEDGWLDEGMVSYSTNLVMDEAFGPRVWTRRYLQPPGGSRWRSGFVAVPFPDIEVSRLLGDLDAYRRSPHAEIPADPTWSYHPGTARSMTYNKPAVWLSTLERHLGWETMRSILSTFFERYRFDHPAPEDFFSVACEVSGQDLSWFFDQVYRDDVAFDYAVDSVTSRPAALVGFADGDDDADGGGPAYRHREPKGAVEPDYRTEVVVRRLGAGRFPVRVLAVFEDGHEENWHWDGETRWKSFVVVRPSRLKHAVVDPERILVLDLDYTNNSRLVEPEPTLPAVKWGAKWMIWLQDLLATYAFYS